MIEEALERRGVVRLDGNGEHGKDGARVLAESRVVLEPLCEVLAQCIGARIGW